MLRAITDAGRLSNRNICGTDDTFCYPVRRPADVAVYYKLPDAGPWSVGQIIILDETATNTLYVMGASQLLQYFSVLFATDSNGDTFAVIRQIQPLYNYDGIQPEITCYSLQISLTGDATSLVLVTEPACYIERYCMKQYTVAWPIEDIDEVTFTTSCDGVTYSFDYLNVPPGMWIEYTGPFIDIFLPENCTLTSATVNEGPIEFSMVEHCFGAQSCQSYVRIEGDANLLYDCFGRFFGLVTDIQEGSNMTQYILRDATDDKRLLLDLLAMNVHNGRIKQIEAKNVPIRVKGSCFISHAEVVDRYKVYSTCAVPVWYQKEVDNVASMQRVILTGTKPLINDYDEWIELIQSQEYQWSAKQNSTSFYPNLIFETCICYKNYTC